MQWISNLLELFHEPIEEATLKIWTQCLFRCVNLHLLTKYRVSGANWKIFFSLIEFKSSELPNVLFLYEHGSNKWKTAKNSWRIWKKRSKTRKTSGQNLKTSRKVETKTLRINWTRYFPVITSLILLAALKIRGWRWGIEMGKREALAEKGQVYDSAVTEKVEWC